VRLNTSIKLGPGCDRDEGMTLTQILRQASPASTFTSSESLGRFSGFCERAKCSNSIYRVCKAATTRGSNAFPDSRTNVRHGFV